MRCAPAQDEGAAGDRDHQRGCHHRVARAASTSATGTTGNPSGDRAAVEELGTVKWYNANKGFGFIAPDQGGKDIFVHASLLERAGITGLAEGQRVAIDVAQGQKGPEAVGLRLI